MRQTPIVDAVDDVESVAALFARLQTTYERLDGWRARSRQLEDPQPGSDLAADIAACPGMPSHELARHALISSVQHLNLARNAVEARDLYPIAHPSVLRGALIGASRAVWLLAPEDARERQQRALRVVWESHRRFRQYAQARQLAPEGIAAFEQMAQEARAGWQDTATLTAKTAPGDGDIIEGAAAHLFPGDPRQRQVSAMWMQGSGDAHGLPWPALSRPGTRMIEQGWMPGYPRRMVSVALGGQLEELVDDFEVIFTITRHGWSLFDQRCTGP